MQLNGYHSASARAGHQKIPFGDVAYEGYEIGTFLNGWCIFLDKFCLDKIGQLDESCSFWYADNLYACQLKAAGIKHAYFCNCQVDHITSRTLAKQNIRLQRQFMLGDIGKFKEREVYYAEREGLY